MNGGASFDFDSFGCSLSPFRWNTQFNAYVVYSPAFFNSSPLDISNCKLLSLCNSTDGQLLVVDSTMTGLNYNTALFISTQTANDKRVDVFIPLRHTVYIHVPKKYLAQNNLEMQNSRVSSHVIMSPTSLSIPVPLAVKNDLSSKPPETLLGDYFRGEQYTHSFFPYPEQGSPRPSCPSFHLMCNRDVAPLDVVLSKLEAEGIPYDVVEDQAGDFGEGIKPDVKLFSFVLQSVRQKEGIHAYLVGEDNHVYGVCLDMGENAFKMVFFPPDFPQFVHMMKMMDVQKLLSWLQTVPLEYVHIYYACLKRHSISIPFPCPSLPEPEDC